MAFWGRGPLVRATVDVRGPVCGMHVEAGGGRWPERRSSDLLTLPAALAALMLGAAGDSHERVGWLVRRVAVGLARTGEGGEVASLDRRPPPAGRDDQVTLELRRSAVGPVPRLVRSPSAGASGRALQALADGVPSAEGLRLAAGLALEGVLGWSAAGASNLQPAQQALAYALPYAVERMEEAGGTVPGALRTAAGQHRLIRPMAGGA